MPSREQVIASLARAANDGVAFAILWHLVFTAVVVAVLAGWRPSNRLAGALAAAPLASVSVFSWRVLNPFNGTVFAALAIALLFLATLFGNREPVSHGAGWSQVVGVCLLAFGWLYPHFLAEHSPLAYLVAAPLGLIPCPTLSAVIGLALVARGLDNRAWSGTVAVAAGFYALFGVVRLAVWMDAVLLVGAVCLTVLTANRGRLSSSPLPAMHTRR